MNDEKSNCMVLKKNKNKNTMKLNNRWNGVGEELQTEIPNEKEP